MGEGGGEVSDGAKAPGSQQVAAGHGRTREGKAGLLIDLQERVAALASLAADLEVCSQTLVSEIIRSAKKCWQVASGEVDLALRRLRSFDRLVPQLEGRAPVGEVALVFPANASLSNPVGTIGVAFLAGNRVVARFPRRLRDWSARLAPLLTARLPGVRLDDRPGDEFLAAMLAEPEVGVVMVFGDDRWIRAYEPPVCASGKKLIFEGPGKDPFLVLPGADVGQAARDAVRAGYYNAGQACTSPERFYVHRDLAREFVEAVVDYTSRQVVGEPERPEVTVGPIASHRVARRIVEQLRDARERGARILVGGRVEQARLPDGTEVTYVEPTVVTGARPQMRLMQEETFGPIIPVEEVASAEEAVRLAANCRYGLAASLYGGTNGEAAALAESHGQVFCQETWLDHYRRNLHPAYGGRKDSGWVWSWEGGRFTRREGPRIHAREFSREAAPG
jgi:succinate-semialdehyde dehydrogenase/glutarate-semialdehyde dehydrogenase